MKNKKHTVKVYREDPRWIKNPSNYIGTIARIMRSEAIGNFCPVFCTYKGNNRCLVKSEAGDLSDPFRVDSSYLETLYITLE